MQTQRCSPKTSGLKKLLEGEKVPERLFDVCARKKRPVRNSIPKGYALQTNVLWGKTRYCIVRTYTTVWHRDNGRELRAYLEAYRKTRGKVDTPYNPVEPRVPDEVYSQVISYGRSYRDALRKMLYASGMSLS
jgi:hypothetical protein